MTLHYISLFALGFTSLFPLINPVGTAIIIDPYFQNHSLHHRQLYSFKIAVYAFLMGVGTLAIGSWCLRFMGVSIPATQMAGGILIARMGLSLLSSEPDNSQPEPSTSPESLMSSLFYPLTFPLTLGPGGISALITLSAHAHRDQIDQTIINTLVLSLSLLTVCIVTYFCFAYSGLVIKRIGQSGSLIVNRLSAFLVFCIGVQMTMNGLKNTFPHLLN